MAIKHINIGAAANDKTGTPARQAGQIINENFDYLENKVLNVNTVITPGVSVLVGQNLTIKAGWVWKINGQQFSNPADVVINFPYAATGKRRFDRIVFNTSNTFTKVVGTESVSNPVAMPVPVDSIDFGVSLVTDSSVGENIPPGDLGEKLDKGGYVGTAQTLKNEINARITSSEKGAVNGVATIGNDGKIPNSQIPALAISETFPVNSQVAMLALSQADQGDIAIRSDISKSFILRASPASILGNWSELLTPTDSVQSVNGQFGNVNLTTVDIQDSPNKRYQTDNQKLFNDATSSIQTQLNSKQANLGFTPEPAFSKNTAFNKNFGVIAGTVAEGNDQRILNGQTAFGWGNHAGLYLPVAGNAMSASKWQTARSLTIGNTAKSVDGSANVSWSLAEIGAQPLLTNPITGTGTAGLIPKFTGVGTLGNSVITDNGTIVTIGNPTYVNQINPNTGDVLRLLNGGTNKLYVNGSAGFGTPTPDNRIHILGNDVSNSRLVLERTTAGATGKYSMGVQNLNNQFGIRDEAQGLDRLVINGSGYLGLGISTPNFTQHNHSTAVDNYTQFTTSASGTTSTDGFIFGLNAGNGVDFTNRENGYLRFFTNNIERYRVHASGGFSIGNSTDPGVGNLSVTGKVTAAPATLGTELVNLNQLNSISRPYKVWTGFISQTGTSAPTVTVIVNELSGNIVWSRSIVGGYTGTLTGGFTSGKTMVFCTKQHTGLNGVVFAGSRISVDTIGLTTSTQAQSWDSELLNASLEIRVYN